MCRRTLGLRMAPRVPAFTPNAPTCVFGSPYQPVLAWLSCDEIPVIRYWVSNGAAGMAHALRAAAPGGNFLLGG